LAYGLFFISVLPLFYMLLKYKEKLLTPKKILLLFTIVALCTFLFMPKMHERYLYPVFPLFAAYIFLETKRKVLIVIYLMLSLLHLLNLYIVWHPIPISLLSYTVLNNQIFQWCIAFCILLTGIVFYTISIAHT